MFVLAKIQCQKVSVMIGHGIQNFSSYINEQNIQTVPEVPFSIWLVHLNIIKSMVNDNLKSFTHDVDGDDIISGFDSLNQTLNYGFIS